MLTNIPESAFVAVRVVDGAVYVDRTSQDRRARDAMREAKREAVRSARRRSDRFGKRAFLNSCL